MKNISLNIKKIIVFCVLCCMFFIPTNDSTNNNEIIINAAEAVASTAIETWDISATEEDSVTASIYEVEGGYSLEITGTGNMLDFTSSTDDDTWENAPWYATYKDSILSVNIAEGITNIGARTFYYCQSMTNVELPSSITQIGEYAFYYCTSLTSIEIPENVTSIGGSAFYNCATLVEIDYNAISLNDFSNYNSVFSRIGNAAEGITLNIGANVTKIPAYIFNPYAGSSYYVPNIISINFEENSVCESIGTYAFAYCSSLTNIEIPENMTSIGNYAFYNCENLNEINFNAATMNDLSSNNYIFYYAGEEGTGIVVNIGSNVTKIPAYLFNPSSNTPPNITEVNFEEGSLCESIGDYAFSYCKYLTNIEIPENITSIGNYAFNSCSRLSTLTIPNGVVSIGNSAFSYCSNLTSITIPESVTSIGNNAFYYCSSIKEINFNAITMNDLSNNNYVFYYAGQNENGIKVNIGSSVTKIPAYLFNPGSSTTYAPNIFSVEFEEDSVCETIGQYSFYACNNMVYINIPSSLTSIGNYAFYNCSGLIEVLNESSLTITSGSTSNGYIGYYAKNIATTEEERKIYIENGFTIYLSDEGKIVLKYEGNEIDIIIPEGVTTIESKVFYNNGDIVSISFPQSLNNIKQEAFYDCTNLEKVYIENVDMWFSIYFEGTTANPLRYADLYINDEMVTSITVPAEITKLNDYIFHGYSSLTSITITENVTSIGNYAFYGCGGLTSITIPENVTNIGNYAFYGCLNVENINFNATSMTDLSSNNYVFYNVGKNTTGLTVSIGQNVLNIPAYLFTPYNSVNYSPNILSVVFEENSLCERIGNYSFAYSSTMEKINIPENVKYIGTGAFYNSTAITEIEYQAKSVNDLSANNMVFYSAGSASSGIVVTFAESVNTIPAYLFNPNDNSTYTPNIIEINFEDNCNCESIGTYAFAYSQTMKKIVIPNGIKSIGEAAFYENINLEEINFKATNMEDLSADNLVFYNAGTSSNGISLTVNSNVTSIPSYLFNPCSDGTSYPKILTFDFEEESICESIGMYAFAYCKELTSVEIPKNIISIGSHAFYYCSKINQINFDAANMNDLPSDSYVFYNAGTSSNVKVVIGKDVEKVPSYLMYTSTSSASKINSIEFEEGSICESIGAYAFAHLINLPSIKLPSSIEKVGNQAFYNCSKLTSVYIDSLEDWMELSFENYASNPLYYAKNLYVNDELVKEFAIPSEITHLNDYLFCGFNAVADLVIPTNVTSIGKGTFYGCNQITSITIHEGINSIGASAFGECSKLTAVYIENIESWLRIPFANETSNPLYYAKKLYLNNELLENLEIPDNIFQINDYAFINCESLLSLNFNDKVASIGTYAFYNCIGLTVLTIPESVEVIDIYAFYGCVNLNEINFNAIKMEDLKMYNYVFKSAGQNGIGMTVNVGKNVQRIPAYLFNPTSSTSSAPNIINLNFEEESICESIGTYAFAYCSSLVDINLPSSLIIIEEKAFYSCSGIQYTTFENCKYVASEDNLYYALVDVVDKTVTELNIHQDVNVIDTACLSGLTKITSISIDDTNLYYKVVDNVLYNEEQTILYKYPAGDSRNTFEIPEGVKEIGISAFYSSKNLKSVTIPSTLEAINKDAFIYCNYLASVNVSDINSFLNIYFQNKNSNPLSYSGSLYLDDTLVETIVFTTEMEVVNDYVLYGCKSIKNVIISNGITSIGTCAFYNCVGIENIDIPNSVTTIKGSAFYGCTNIKTITIPENITSIESYAFYNCKGLIEINFNATNMSDLKMYNYVFANAGSNSGAIYVKIGKNVKRIPAYLFTPYQTQYNPQIESIIFEEDSVCESIGEYAFYDLTKLTSTVIPNSISSIEICSFSGANNLNTIYYAGTIEEWNSIEIDLYNDPLLTAIVYYYSEVAPDGDGYYWRYVDGIIAPWTKFIYELSEDETYYIISGIEYNNETKILVPEICDGKEIKEIGESAFSGYPIVEIVLPKSLTIIGESAFADCSNLVSITIPSSVLSIGVNAFKSCSNLETIKFEENSNCESIGSNAFYECVSLSSVTIPESVTSIGGSAFGGCTNIEEIYYNAENLDDLSEYNYIFEFVGQNTAGAKVIIGKNVRKIPNNFLGTKRYESDSVPNITSVYFEEGSVCESIGENAFYQMLNLATINLPEIITEVGDYAFYECSNTKDDAKLNKLSSIGDYAFYNCKQLLSEVTINSEYLQSYAFYNCESLTSITLGEKLTKIYSDAIYNCVNLEEVNLNSIALSDFVMTQYSKNNNFYKAGQNTEGIIVNIGENVTRVPSNIFYPGEYSYCKIKEINFAENGVCESIGEKAFYGSFIGTSLIIPESITTIGDSVFGYCPNLTNVFYNSSAMNNMFDSKTGDMGNGISLTVGASVTNLGAILSENNYLINVYFEEGSICESIGNYAFYNCNALSKLEIPKSVTTISYGAFDGCSNLEEINLDNVENIGWSSFIGCDLQGELNLSNVKSIGESAFASCDKITSVILGDKINYVGADAFKFCTQIGSVKISSIDSWLNIEFENEYSNPLIYADELLVNDEVVTSVVITEDNTEIKAYAFYNYGKLTEIYIESNLTKIGIDAFVNCYNLEKVIINSTDTWLNIEFSNLYANPCAYGALYLENEVLKEVVINENIQEIKDYVFYNAELEQVKGGKNVTSIGSYAFYGCDKLVSIEPFEKLAYIGDYSFEYCDKLLSIEIPETVTYIGNHAFYGCIGLNEIIYNVPSLADFTDESQVFGKTYNDKAETKLFIGNQVQRIPSYLFNNSKICSVEFEQNSICTEIGDYSFADCQSMSSINIPKSIESIGTYAFEGCNKFLSIEIPENVLSIGDGAFKDCSSVTHINFNATAMNDLSESNNVFYDVGENANVVIGSNVTKIPSYLFNSTSDNYSNPKIVSISFEENSSIESVGEYAFANLTCLKGLSLPTTVETLSETVLSGSLSKIISIDVNWNLLSLFDLEKIETLKINSGNYDIEDSQFYGFDNLISVTLLGNIDRIGESAFENCSNLEIIELSDSITEIGTRAFYNSGKIDKIIIPSSVTCIKESTFENSKLKEITISNNVTSIGTNAFYNCQYLEKINFNATLLDDLVEKNNAFYLVGRKTKGTKIIFGANVQRVPSNLFYSSYSDEAYNSYNNYYPNISKMEFEEGSICESIGTYAFKDCYVLENIIIPENIILVENYAFYNCKNVETIEYDAIYMEDLSKENYIFFGVSQKNASSVIIGDKVTRIPAYLFTMYLSHYSNPNISKVVFTDGSVCQSIGAYAFYDNQITYLALPDSLVLIEEGSFESNQLKSITIPEGVKTIEGEAFAYNSELEEINFNAEAMNDVTFENIEYYCSPFVRSGSSTGIRVNVGENVTRIPAYLFHGRYEYIEEDDGYNYLFSRYPNVKEVIFAENAICSEIGEYAFYNCINLDRISDCSVGNVIPRCVTSIGTNAFTGTNIERLHSTQEYLGTTGLVYTIVDDYTVIGNQFTYILGDAFVVTGIGNFTADSIEYNEKISSKYNISVIVIDDDITSINGNVFNNLEDLKRVVIGSSVESYDGGIFNGCNNLLSIYFKCDFNYGMSKKIVESSLNNFVIYYNKKANGWDDFTYYNVDTTSAYYIWSNSKVGTTNYPVTALGDSLYLEACDSYYRDVQGVEYDINGYITGFESIGVPVEELVIPKQVIYPDGSIKDVTKISANSFSSTDSKEIEIINVYAAINSIENGAFYGCTNLVALYFIVDCSMPVIDGTIFNDRSSGNYVAFVVSNPDETWVENPCSNGLLYTISELDSNLYDINGIKYTLDSSTSTAIVGRKTTTTDVGEYNQINTSESNGQNIVIPEFVKDVSGEIYMVVGFDRFAFYKSEVETIKFGAFIGLRESSSNPAIWESTFREMPNIISFEVSGNNTNYFVVDNTLYGNGYNVEVQIEGEIINTRCNTRLIKAPAEIPSGFTVADGTTVIEKYAFSNSTIKEINLNQVNIIGSHAFYGCVDLTNVSGANVYYIEDSAFENAAITSFDFTNVTHIATRAFYNSDLSGSVSLRSDINVIGQNTFSLCENIASFVKTDNSLSEYRVFDDVLFRREMDKSYVLMQYPLAKSTETYDMSVVSQTISAIDSYAFANAKYLSEIIMSDDTVTVGSYAFSGISSLDSVYIGKSYYGSYTGSDSGLYTAGLFRESNLSKITVSPENRYFCNDENGAMYSKDLSTLYCYPSGIERVAYTVPYETETIYSDAFFGNTHIIRVILLNDSISYIGDEAFSDCSNLKELYLKSTTLPESGVKLFENTADLTVKVLESDDVTLPSKWHNATVETYTMIEELPNESISTIDYTFVIVDSDGNALVDASVALYIGDNLYYLITNDYGIAVFSEVEGLFEAGIERQIIVSKEEYFELNQTFYPDEEMNITYITLTKEPTVAGVSCENEDINSSLAEINLSNYTETYFDTRTGEPVPDYAINELTFMESGTKIAQKINIEVVGYFDSKANVVPVGCVLFQIVGGQEVVITAEVLSKEVGNQVTYSFWIPYSNIIPDAPIYARFETEVDGNVVEVETMLNINVYDFTLTEDDINLSTDDLDVGLNFGNDLLSKFLGDDGLAIEIGDNLELNLIAEDDTVTVGLGYKTTKSKKFGTDYKKGYEETCEEKYWYQFIGYVEEGLGFQKRYTFSIFFARGLESEGVYYYQLRICHESWSNKIVEKYGMVTSRNGAKTLTAKAFLIFQYYKKTANEEEDITAGKLYLDYAKNQTEKVEYNSKFTFEIEGSLTFKVSNEGIKLVSGEIKGAISYKFTLYQQLQVWIIPILVKVEIDAGGGLTLKLAFEEDYTIKIEELRGQLELELKVSLGPGCQAVSAGVYGQIGTLLTFELIPNAGLIDWSVSGEVGWYAHALTFSAEGKWWSGTEYIYKDGIYVWKDSKEASTAAVYLASNYSFESRDKLQEQAKIINLNNELYKIYFVDAYDADKYDEYNYKKLAYSKWLIDEQAWSEAVIIDDNGYSDLSYSLYFENDNLYLTYLQSSSILDEQTANDTYYVAENSSLKMVDLSTGFDSVSSSIVSKEDGYKYLQSATIVNGIPTIVWAENSDNNMFGVSPDNYIDANGDYHIFETTANAIYTSQFINNEWKTTKLVDGLHTITNVSITTDGRVMIVVDENCDLSNYEDRKLYYISEAGKLVNVINEESGQIFGLTANGEKAIIYYFVSNETGEKIYYVEEINPSVLESDNLAILEQAGITAENYEIVYDNLGSISGVIYVVDGQTGSQLCAKWYEDSTWSDEVIIKDLIDGYYIDNMDVKYMNNNLFVVVYYVDSNGTYISQNSYSITSGEEVNYNVNIPSETYKFIKENDSIIGVLYAVDSNEVMGSDLCAKMYDSTTKTWGNQVVVKSAYDGYYISGFDAEIIDELLVITTEYSDINGKYIDSEISTHDMVSEISCEYSVDYLNKVVSVSVENIGLKPITIQLQYSSVNVDEYLASGMNILTEISFTELGDGTIYIKENDNIITEILIPLYYSDMTVQSKEVLLGDTRNLIIAVKNTGTVEGSGILDIKSENGEISHRIEVESVPANGIKYYTVSIDNSLLKYGENILIMTLEGFDSELGNCVDNNEIYYSINSIEKPETTPIGFIGNPSLKSYSEVLDTIPEYINIEYVCQEGESISEVRVLDLNGNYVALEINDNTVDKIIEIETSFINDQSKYTLEVIFGNEYNDTTIIKQFDIIIQKYYSISFDVNGVVTTETVMEGSIPTVPTEITKPESVMYTYEFAGWDTDEDGEADTKSVIAANKDVEYVAVFTNQLRQYEVTWIFNQGYDDEIAVQEQYYYGDIPSYLGNIFIPSGMRFVGFDSQITSVFGDVSYVAQYVIKGSAKAGNTNDYSVAVGSQFTTSVYLTDIVDITKTEVTITYDINKVDFISYALREGVSLINHDVVNGILVISLDASSNVSDLTLIDLTLKVKNEISVGENSYLSVTGLDSITNITNSFIIHQDGDSNMDGVINILDLMLIKKYMLGEFELTDVQKEYANAYADDSTDEIEINILDLMLIKKMMLNQTVEESSKTETEEVEEIIVDDSATEEIVETNVNSNVNTVIAVEQIAIDYVYFKKNLTQIKKC